MDSAEAGPELEDVDPMPEKDGIIVPLELYEVKELVGNALKLLGLSLICCSGCVEGTGKGEGGKS